MSEAEDAAPAAKPAMPRAQRAYVIATCALIAGAFAYAANEWGSWTRITYLPLAEELTLSPPPAITIAYYGMFAWGLGGMLVGALVGALLCAIVPRPWPDRVLHLFGAWALTALVLAGSYYTWGLWPW